MGHVRSAGRQRVGGMLALSLEKKCANEAHQSLRLLYVELDRSAGAFGDDLGQERIEPRRVQLVDDSPRDRETLVGGRYCRWPGGERSREGGGNGEGRGDGFVQPVRRAGEVESLEGLDRAKDENCFGAVKAHVSEGRNQ